MISVRRMLDSFVHCRLTFLSTTCGCLPRNDSCAIRHYFAVLEISTEKLWIFVENDSSFYFYSEITALAFGVTWELNESFSLISAMGPKTSSCPFEFPLDLGKLYPLVA